MSTERRAEQRRFDDAVGRLYRVVELMAQTWLKQRHGIDTGNVDIARVPDAVKAIVARERSEKGVIEIGLLLAWDVVAAFADDPLGAYFQSERDAVQHFLGVRNRSLFAHGITPINARDYRQHAQRVLTFVQTAMDRAIVALNRKRGVILPQLPTEWE
jgi:CRISPR-associated protein (TIGR02710 family)